jgi:hypothetical protein
MKTMLGRADAAAASGVKARVSSTVRSEKRFREGVIMGE